jgi:hypothetical protein
MFSCISSEKRVSVEHPLRPIRKTVDEIPREMSPQFAKCIQVRVDRRLQGNGPLLLQIFYSVRSERMLIEQLQ